MNDALLILAWLMPLVLAPLALGAAGRWWPTLATVPALAAALLVPVGTVVEVPWLLLGVQLGLDPTGRPFLLFSAILWLFAGLYGALSPTRDERAGRFRLFFLLAMAGNLLLILAADMLTFYAGFALMGLSAYGLVVQRRSQRARRAGRVFLAWTLVGELALFSAVLLLAAGAETLRFADLAGRELPGAAVALLLLGFGVKLALPGLHVWLPLVYPAAPPVAAAVLSGPMINAGLLGWLRFLPPGAPGLAAWGEPLVAVGVVGVVLGVAVGVTQRDPRALLGYSSIAKMGLITAVFGTALARPEAAPVVVAALVVFAMHHLLVKGALFLGLGEWERAGNRSWVIAGLGLLALAMAGAPLTAGALAKTALGDALAGVGADLGLLILLSATGTALLMARLMWLVTRTRSRQTADGRSASLSWLVLAFLALWLPFHPAALTLSGDGLVPLGIGLALAGLAWAMTRGRVRPWRGIPPGDVLYLIPLRPLRRRLRIGHGRLPARVFSPTWRRSPAGERAPPLAVAGLLWLSILVSLLSLVLMPG